MNDVKKNNMLIVWEVIIIFILMGVMCKNIVSISGENVNNFSTINRMEMHPLDSLRFKFI